MTKNWLKSLTLGLAAFAGGTGAASGQVEYGSADFTLTNASAIYTVYGLPRPATTPAGATFDVLESNVYTDAAGKISGYAMYGAFTSNRIDTLTTNTPPETNTTYVVGTASTVMCRVTGKLGTSVTTPTLVLKVRGKGVSMATNDTGNAVLNFTFKGAGSSSNITGVMNGGFRPGIQSIAPITFKNTPATLNDCAGTQQIQVDQMLVLRNGGDLLASGGTFFAAQSRYFQGTGRIKPDGALTLKLKGAGADQGAQFTLEGNAYGHATDTNYITITSLSATGKVLGQKVSTLLSGTGYIDP